MEWLLVAQSGHSYAVVRESLPAPQAPGKNLQWRKRATFFMDGLLL
jgi:hypothetical protein